MDKLFKGWLLEQAAREAICELELPFLDFCVPGINVYCHQKVPDFCVNVDYLIECKHWECKTYYISPRNVDNEILSRFTPYPDKKKILVISKYKPQNKLVDEMLKDTIIIELGFMVHTNFMEKATSIIKRRLKEILGLNKKKPLKVSSKHIKPKAEDMNKRHAIKYSTKVVDSVRKSILVNRKLEWAVDLGRVRMRRLSFNDIGEGLDSFIKELSRLEGIFIQDYFSKKDKISKGEVSKSIEMLIDTMFRRVH